MENQIIPTEILFKILSQNGQYCILNRDMRNKKNIYYVQFFEQNDEENIKKFIMKACTYGKIDIIDFWLKYTDDISNILYDATLAAVGSGHFDLTELLLGYYHLIAKNLDNRHHVVIIDTSTRSENVEVVKLIIEYMTNNKYHSVLNHFYNTFTLEYKITNLSIDNYVSSLIVEHILNSNGDIQNIFEFACLCKSYILIEMLLNEQRIASRITNIHRGIAIATEHKNIEVAKYLINRYSLTLSIFVPRLQEELISIGVF